MSETQRMVRDSLEKLFSRIYAFEQRQQVRRAAPGFSREAWNAYADLGLFGLGIAEDAGGLGGDLADIANVVEAMGAAMALEPYLSTMAFGGRLIAASGSDAQKAEHLGAIAAGERIVALAHGERANRYALEEVETEAAARDGAFILEGAKTVVPGGDAADLFVVSARIASEPSLALFLVPADTAGLVRHGYRNFDGTGAADIVLDQVRLSASARLGGPNSGLALLERAMAEAIALDCSDAVGAMRALNQLTLDYARTRRQFGTTIGSFQVLQHRLVDMMIAQELAAAMTKSALAAVDGADPDQRDRAIAAAKVRVAESARFVAQQAVQLHGGMGLTEEYPAAHYFARLGMFERRWGDADHHLARFAEQMAEA